MNSMSLRKSEDATLPKQTPKHQNNNKSQLASKIEQAMIKQSTG